VLLLLLLPPQGIYMLQDNSFRWLLRVAPAAAAPEASRPAEYLATVAQPYLELPCGIIRGGFAIHLLFYWLVPLTFKFRFCKTMHVELWHSVRSSLGQHAIARYSELCS
jgi:hypothetical protein